MRYLSATYGPHGGERPHVGGCLECAQERKCSVCGEAIKASTRCTNGRCPACHARVCTDGGTGRPGHAYGNAKRPARNLACRGCNRDIEEGSAVWDEYCDVFEGVHRR